ncbi:lipase 3-like [Musca vetustissima]|uniref:lipase 3-like n=1 Tax=Musca vetustissima TaxID=27455 RepID=UPI002AB6F170|nr:lipase 3-like [Musca vetustissima]
MLRPLQHCSDCWVIRELENPLAFELVDKGYDVWLGNARGNAYGERHVKMTSNDRRFWRFSWHEIGTIDLPSMIDYILKETQQSSLHYVGHSQGCTIMLVLLSTHPEYNSRLKSVHLLAPAAYMANVRAPLFQLLVPIFVRSPIISELLGDIPLLQIPLLHQLLGLEQCRTGVANPEYCSSLLFMVAGGYSRYLNHDIYATHPSPSSTHQAIHYVQLKISGRFRQYDFGREGNILQYNHTAPPEYPLENINPKFPLHLYYSDYDELATRKDIEKLSKLLGNRSVDHYIDLKEFAHIDFIWANNIHEVINRPILEIMQDTEELLAKNNTIL